MPVGNIKKVNNDLDFLEVKFDEETVNNNNFYLIENWINIEIEFKNIRSLSIIFLFNSKKFDFYYRGNCKDKYYFGDNYQGKICLIYLDGDSFTIRKNDEVNKIYEVDNYFLNEGYKKFYLSQDLIHMRSKLKMAYGLEYYSNDDDKCLLFGVYNQLDLLFLKGKVGILWGGSDIMLDKKNRKKAIEIINKNKYENYAMSEKIYNKLVELGCENIKRVNISFCCNDLKYLIQWHNYYRKKAIYIYDGLDKNLKKRIIYNQNIVDNLIPFLEKDFKIIRSSDGFCNDVISLYKQSFISLRLTIYDGNANSAQECGMLGIPVISNQEMNNCISWKEEEEIIHKIRYVYEKDIKIKWRKDGVNLLFISNDSPGKGGGATFTENLRNYLAGRGFNIFEIYLEHNNKESVYKNGRRYVIRYNHKKRWDLISWIDKTAKNDKDFGEFIDNGCKIVLRSYLNDIRKLQDRFEVIFFAPGIYKNDMEKEFNIKHVNTSNLKTANIVETYANSALTQGVYHKMGLNDVRLLEINLLQINNFIASENRDIDFLFVVSNIERKIKNTKLFIELAKKMKRKFVLVSAEDIKSNLNNIDVVVNPNNIDDYYKKSKCLINCSYFDSMSNVVLEGINNGCHVVVSQSNGIVDYIKDDIRNNFVVESYDLKDWENKLEYVLSNWDKLLNDRKKLWSVLKRKSWEVEVKLLELLN